MTNITWPGNDSRFVHRAGGSDAGNGRWRDGFGADNQNEYVCSASIPIDAGNHVVAWTIQMIFAEPVCRNPKPGYPAFLANVIVPGVKPNFALISQPNVCANRIDLVWSGDFAVNFSVPKASNVLVGIAAFDDQQTDNQTSTGAKEAIVIQMKINPSPANVGNVVWPLEVYPC